MRPALAAGELLIDTTTADAKQLAVGDTERVTFARTGPATIRIGGIYEPNVVFGNCLVGGRFFLDHFDTPLTTAVPSPRRGAPARPPTPPWSTDWRPTRT